MDRNQRPSDDLENDYAYGVTAVGPSLAEPLGLSGPGEPPRTACSRPCSRDRAPPGKGQVTFSGETIFGSGANPPSQAIPLAERCRYRKCTGAVEMEFPVSDQGPGGP